MVTKASAVATVPAHSCRKPAFVDEEDGGSGEAAPARFGQRKTKAREAVSAKKFVYMNPVLAHAQESLKMGNSFFQTFLVLSNVRIPPLHEHAAGSLATRTAGSCSTRPAASLSALIGERVPATSEPVRS